MLLSKTKNLESENNGMEEAIDLMKVELQNMNTNEQGLVSKLRYIDSQNQALLEESSPSKRVTFTRTNPDNWKFSSPKPSAMKESLMKTLSDGRPQHSIAK